MKGAGWAPPALASVWTFLPLSSNFGVRNNGKLLHITVNSVHSHNFLISWEEGEVDFHSYDNAPSLSKYGNNSNKREDFD